MCEGGLTARENSEGEFEALLCKDCLDKVEQKLLGTDFTLFDFKPDEYGFCRDCWKKIRYRIKLNEQGF